MFCLVGNAFTARMVRADVNNTTVSGIQSMLSGGQTPLSGVHMTKEDSEEIKKDETHDIDAADNNSDKKTKGYVKVTTHGIKKKSNSEGRSYHCGVCGVRKRSAHNLNVHHKK